VAKDKKMIPVISAGLKEDDLYFIGNHFRQLNGRARRVSL
jgi:hypothetical protein